jgi:hypothetical protein
MESVKFAQQVVEDCKKSLPYFLKLGEIIETAQRVGLNVNEKAFEIFRAAIYSDIKATSEKQSEETKLLQLLIKKDDQKSNGSSSSKSSSLEDQIITQDSNYRNAALQAEEARQDVLSLVTEYRRMIAPDALPSSPSPVVNKVLRYSPSPVVKQRSGTAGNEETGQELRTSLHSGVAYRNPTRPEISIGNVQRNDIITGLGGRSADWGRRNLRNLRKRVLRTATEQDKFEDRRELASNEVKKKEEHMAVLEEILDSFKKRYEENIAEIRKTNLLLNLLNGTEIQSNDSRIFRWRWNKPAEETIASGVRSIETVQYWQNKLAEATDNISVYDQLLPTYKEDIRKARNDLLREREREREREESFDGDRERERERERSKKQRALENLARLRLQPRSAL